jgi:hypothetical protein
MIVIYDRSFIVLANGITIVNYDRKDFIVQATGRGGTVVEPSTQYPKIKGSTPVVGE